MLFSASPNRQRARFAALSISALSATGFAALAVSHPAAMASALMHVETLINCNATTACVTGANAGTGPGLSGTSAKGAGIVAKGSTSGVTASGAIGVTATGTNRPGVLATSTSGYGLFGTSSSLSGVKGSSTSFYGVEGTSNTNYGVSGTTQSGSAGVFGTTPSSGDGVYGTSYSGYGVHGSSTYGTALYGRTSSGSFGVYGTTGNGLNYGVVGYVSSSGTGVAGTTSSGFGVEGNADNGSAIGGYSGSGNGVYAYSTSGFALDAQTYGSRAIEASNYNGDGADISGTYIGIIGRAPASGGYPLVATDQNANVVFQVDGAGNIAYSGSLLHLASSISGTKVKSYTPRTAVPTAEDVGTAQLVAGSAAVRLDPTFASTIDTRAGYRVFLTPNGDTRGLFVPLKTAAGFMVRETQGGHSTLSFDYRIVATPLGEGDHQTATTRAALSAQAPILTVAAPKSHRPPALNSTSK